MAAREVDDVVAQRGGGEGHRLTRDHGARAGEGAGVVRREIGVGIDDRDAIRAGGEHGGGELPV